MMNLNYCFYDRTGKVGINSSGINIATSYILYGASNANERKIPSIKYFKNVANTLLYGYG